VFLAGFSLGSMQVLSCAVAENTIDGVVVISHMWDLIQGVKVLERPLQSRLFGRVIIQFLKRLYSKNPEMRHRDLSGIHTLQQFDDAYTSRDRGYDGSDPYYKASAVYPKIPLVKVPTMLIGADDDPFTLKEVLPIKESKESQKVVLVHTKEGGHAAFVSGWMGRGSLVDSVVPDFFQSIMDDRTSDAK
jgi:predicted alpha/beta-fold hydrolase